MNFSIYSLFEIVSAKIYVGIVDLKAAIPYTLEFKIKQNDIIIHENYDITTIKNDIGLIRSAHKIPQHASVNFISLPSRVETNEDLVGKTGFVSGFGRNSDGKLIQLNSDCWL